MKISTVIIISIIAAIVIILSAFYMYAMDSPYRISSEEVLSHKNIILIVELKNQLIPNPHT